MNSLAYFKKHDFLLTVQDIEVHGLTHSSEHIGGCIQSGLSDSTQ